MKKTLFIILILVWAGNLFAQDINPFESIGKKGKVLTLSNGKYPEVHPYDSLQRIGSVVVNMNTGLIVDFLQTDTLYSESTLDPTVISRWYSIDPLAMKYPSFSPYNFCANNPIIYVDGDGREVIPSASFKSNEKLSAVLAIAQKTDIYMQLVKTYSTTQADLYLGYNPTQPSSMVAYTNFYLSNPSFTKPTSVTAYSNWDIKLGDEKVGSKDFSSNLLVSVLFHEVIHANISLYEYVTKDLGDERYSKMSDYSMKYSDPARAEHEFIADHFRGDLAQGIKQFDQAQNSPLREDKYYDALAWGGLTNYRDADNKVQETDAWKKYKETASNEDVEYIIKTLDEENSKTKIDE